MNPAPAMDPTASFRRDGYVVIPDLLDQDEVAATRADLSRLAREADGFGGSPAGWHLDFEPGQPTGGDDRELRVRKFRDIGLGDAAFWDLVRHRRTLEAVDGLIGPGAQLLQTMALVKPPEIGSAKDWHQDIPYFPLEAGTRVVGVWIALDDATLENGCMQVVPGSHHLGPVAHVQGSTGWRLEPVLCEHLLPAVVPLPMAAGSALLFDGALFHFTDINRSRQRRRALQNHYVSAAARLAAGRTGRLFDLSSSLPPFQRPNDE